MKAASLDDLHGDTVVATIEIHLMRSGMMRLSGSITDEAFTLHMLDTARDVVKNYHGRASKADSPIIVPAHDTSLVGTESEKKLLQARHDLASAM